MLVWLSLYDKLKGMRLNQIYSENSKPVISFEVFPPKGEDNSCKLDKLDAHLTILKKYNPAFISVTYGAGGTNQLCSFDVIKKIKECSKNNIMPHFTCVNTKKSNVKDYLNEISELNIENILALRGDIPEGVKHENFDFKYANELVEFIKKNTDLSVGVAGYPEVHKDCDDSVKDLKNLKNKVDAGADAVFTQMFFDNQKYFSFFEKVSAMGINVPVIPGILPIRNYSQLDKMLSMARVTLPLSLMEKLDKFKESPDDIKKIGIEFAIKQCDELIGFGVKGLHFYTLNTSSSVVPILDGVGY